MGIKCLGAQRLSQATTRSLNLSTRGEGMIETGPLFLEVPTAVSGLAISFQTLGKQQLPPTT